MARIFFYFSVALAALVALLVSAMNAGRVEVELAFLRIATPLGLALVVAFVVGLLAGLFWRVYWVAELLDERGRLRRALRRPRRARGPLAAAGENAGLTCRSTLVVALFVAAAAGWLVAQFRLRDRAPRPRRPSAERPNVLRSQEPPRRLNEEYLKGLGLPAQRGAGQGARSVPADGRRRQRDRRNALRARQPLSAARRSGARDPHPREHHGAPVAQRRASPGRDVRAGRGLLPRRAVRSRRASRFGSSPRATRAACRRCAICCASTSSSATGSRRSRFTTSSTAVASPEQPTAIAHYHCELAEQARERGDFDAAREHLHRARDAQRNFPRGALIRADIALDMNEPELAALLCQRVVELHPRLLALALPRVLRAVRGSDAGDIERRFNAWIRPEPSARAELAYAAIVAGLEQEPFVRDCLPDLLREDPSLGEIVRSRRAAIRGSSRRSSARIWRRASRASCAARSAIVASIAASRAHRTSGNAPAAAAGTRSRRSRCSTSRRACSRR